MVIQTLEVLSASEIYQYPGYPFVPFQMFSTCVNSYLCPLCWKSSHSFCFLNWPLVDLVPQGKSTLPSGKYPARHLASPRTEASSFGGRRWPTKQGQKDKQSSARPWLCLRRKEIIKQKHRTMMSASLTEKHRMRDHTSTGKQWSAEARSQGSSLQHRLITLTSRESPRKGVAWMVIFSLVHWTLTF